MKCPNCGAESSAKFCENCGTALEQEQNTQTQVQQPAQQQFNNVPDAQPKEKKSIFKKWWFWVIVVVIIGIIAAAGASRNPKKEKADNGTPAVSSDNNANKDKNTTPNSKDDFAIGETAVFKDIKVTATEMKESEGTEYFKPADGKIFVGVNFTIENISDQDQIISSILLFDAYADGVKCDFSSSARMTFSDGSLDATVSSGKKLVGWYAVEVPKNWGKLELEVKGSWLSTGKAVFVINK